MDVGNYYYRLPHADEPEYFSEPFYSSYCAADGRIEPAANSLSYNHLRHNTSHARTDLRDCRNDAKDTFLQCRTCCPNNDRRYHPVGREHSEAIEETEGIFRASHDRCQGLVMDRAPPRRLFCPP